MLFDCAIFPDEATCSNAMCIWDASLEVKCFVATEIQRVRGGMLPAQFEPTLRALKAMDSTDGGRTFYTCNVAATWIFEQLTGLKVVPDPGTATKEARTARDQIVALNFGATLAVPVNWAPMTGLDCTAEKVYMLSVGYDRKFDHFFVLQTYKNLLGQVHAVLYEAYKAMSDGTGAYSLRDELDSVQSGTILGTVPRLAKKFPCTCLSLQHYMHIFTNADKPNAVAIYGDIFGPEFEPETGVGSFQLITSADAVAPKKAAVKKGSATFDLLQNGFHMKKSLKSKRG
jgi:hypothetical protein